MSAGRQQGRSYQRSQQGPQEGLRHGVTGDGGTEAGTPEESQTPTASDRARALTERTSSRDTRRCKGERNRRIRQVRPVVWEDGGREAPSYPIAGKASRLRSGRK
jgi:hypothetical protein